MQETHWHPEQSVTLTDSMLLAVLGLVVATLWWRAVADCRSLRRKERRNAAMQNGDAAFWHARWRKARVNVVLEFTMAVIVTLASACVLAFLYPYY
ncbi:hypothetical protein [Pantoea cypripedii]|uniref:Uncharacterized protein n=1 Tax=Pantoea cypripedii TaxID=55209 RepID=A0A1X1EME6_PANCY|nr:hypothetical protein [Pantoea cypripedii]MBP2200584.1 hypothetical protein [Pantoea cypripedii]ORM90081.1 hypothetical protein HA50_26275 [Pantoea cypripedii]